MKNNYYSSSEFLIPPICKSYAPTKLPHTLKTSKTANRKTKFPHKFLHKRQTHVFPLRKKSRFYTNSNIIFLKYIPTWNIEDGSLQKIPCLM